LIFSLTFVGSYSYNNSITDVLIMIGAGIAGYFLRKFEFSMSAIIIGIILGKMAETNFRGALMMSDGSFSIFVLSPISLVLLIASLISLLSPIIGNLFFQKKKT